MSYKDTLIYTSSWNVDIDTQYKEEFDDKGDLWLNHYSRTREVHFVTGEKKPWSEWDRSGVGVKIGETVDTSFFERIDMWFKNGEWKDKKIVRYLP
jgi:hypothetical protein